MSRRAAPWFRALLTVCACGAAAGAALCPRTARADEELAWSSPPPPRRPRMSVAIGMGATFDDSGFSPERTKAIPSFAAVGDIGDGPIGFAMGVYASAASGRYRTPDLPVDRLALDLMTVLRPFQLPGQPPDPRYVGRVARASGLELGLGFERDGQSTLAGSRFGLHTGVRMELPLTPAGQRTGVYAYLAARRLIGFYEPIVGTTTVRNSVELFAALGASF